MAVSSQQDSQQQSAGGSQLRERVVKSESSVPKAESRKPTAIPTDIVLTAGASCPDVLLDEVLRKIVGWFPNSRSVEEVLKS